MNCKKLDKGLNKIGIDCFKKIIEYIPDYNYLELKKMDLKGLFTDYFFNLNETLLDIRIRRPLSEHIVLCFIKSERYSVLVLVSCKNDYFYFKYEKFNDMNMEEIYQYIFMLIKKHNKQNTLKIKLEKMDSETFII